ncbi:hypothetical protein C0T31_04620 [Dysgonamonadaceae bacterium]|nr:hypothetical protein C0T31_04620 [Dysgonamonadaceae bacterium]
MLLKKHIPQNLFQRKHHQTSSIRVKGKLVAKIGKNIGILSEWKRKSKNGSVEKGEIHPNTLEPIKGKVIAHWKLIKEKILNYVKRTPFFDYVGWDSLVTENDFVVIEANHNPDLDLVQIHKLFLKDDRVLNFFKYITII